MQELDQQTAIANIRVVFNESKRFRNYLWLDECAFFIATSRLKKSLSSTVRRYARMTGENGLGINCIRAIDELEQCVESGSMHFMGKVLVREQDFEAKLQAVEQSCVFDERAAQEWEASNPATPEELLEVARQQAEAIIAQAQEEAARIVSESLAAAKKRGPWNH
jgi:hypothetical protein